jgi:hypothetical protein
MSSSKSRSTFSGGRRARRRRILALVVGLVVAAIGGEITLRWLLFGESETAQRLGRRWRRMELYTDRADDDWWKLQWLFQRDKVVPPPNPDPLLGWTGAVSAGAYAAPDEDKVGDRTPVLLYGDSNAQCMTTWEECFQGIMEKSDLSDRYALLNYGVGGYGLDQIQRLISASIDRHAGKNPIVVVSLLVDDDLERSMLDFRCWPKPRYELAHGSLVEPGPVETDAERYLELHPPRIQSYLWRLARGAWRPFDWEAMPDDAGLEERRALNRALLERIRDDLESRNLRWFLLLFQMDGWLAESATARWSQGVVDEFVAAHDVPCIPLAQFFLAVNGSREVGLGDMVGHDPILMDHLNDGGNKVVFEAIRQGIAALADGNGRIDHLDLEHVRRMNAAGAFAPDKAQVRGLTVLGCAARFEGRTRANAVRYRAPTPGGPTPRLSMRGGDDGRSRLEIDVSGTKTRMSARVRAVSVGNPACSGTVRLSSRTDEGEWNTDELEIGVAGREWSLDARGARKIEIEVVYEGENPTCAWIALEDLKLD